MTARENIDKHRYFNHNLKGKSKSQFPLRLFQYYYRLFDRYQIPVITLAVLVDNRKKWRPEQYHQTVWGQDIIRFHFFTAKLLDYAEKRSALEETDNPFGIVTLAQLAALKTRRNPEARYQIKFSLTRRLYGKGWGKDAILSLYRFLDWVLTLPKPLEIQYNDDIKRLEGEQSVNYITSAERIGIEKGLAQGFEKGLLQGERKLLTVLLRQKFPHIDDRYLKEVEQEQDENKLFDWVAKAMASKTVEDIFDSHCGSLAI